MDVSQVLAATLRYLMFSHHLRFDFSSAPVTIHCLRDPYSADLQESRLLHLSYLPPVFA